MTIDLKVVNYKSHRGHDGDGYNAEIVYKGKKIAHAYDDAWGGGTQYTTLGDRKTKEYVENQRLFDELLLEVVSLPGVDKFSKKYPQLELDCVVDNIINDLVRKKEEKRGIQCNRPNGYETLGWTVSLPTFLKKYSGGLSSIQKLYNELKAEGEEILNGEYLQSIGVEL